MGKKENPAHRQGFLFSKSQDALGLLVLATEREPRNTEEE